jgi:hypothetical protein
MRKKLTIQVSDEFYDGSSGGSGSAASGASSRKLPGRT